MLCEEKHNFVQPTILQLAVRQAERDGVVQHGEEISGTPHFGLPIPEGVYNKEEGEIFLIWAGRDRTRGSAFKLQDNRFRLAIRKKFFTQRVKRHRNTLAREVLDALSL